MDFLPWVTIIHGTVDWYIDFMNYMRWTNVFRFRMRMVCVMEVCNSTS
jgi:hypothetical protein